MEGTQVWLTGLWQRLHGLRFLAPHLTRLSLLTTFLLGGVWGLGHGWPVGHPEYQLPPRAKEIRNSFPKSSRVPGHIQLVAWSAAAQRLLVSVRPQVAD